MALNTARTPAYANRYISNAATRLPPCHQATCIPLHHPAHQGLACASLLRTSAPSLSSPRGVLTWHCAKPMGAALQSDPGVWCAATTLCALHYIACSLSIWVTQTFGGVKRVTLPFSGDPLSSSGGCCCKSKQLAVALLSVSHSRNTCSGARTDLVLFTATANVSIVSLNLSLMINQVGFYQVCCPCRIPTVPASHDPGLDSRDPRAVPSVESGS